MPLYVTGRRRTISIKSSAERYSATLQADILLGKPTSLTYGSVDVLWERLLHICYYFGDLILKMKKK